MLGQALIALVAGVLCCFLAVAVFRQGNQWNRILGKTQWDQTICSWILSGIVGLIGGGLLIFAVIAAFQAGYNR